MKLLKVISAKTDNKLRLLIKALRLGKNDVQEIIQASSYGDDSNPIKDMIAVYSETATIGEPVIIGYVNKNSITEPGEKRIFSTDENGNVVMYLHLKNDGTAEFNGNTDNLVRYSELKTAFDNLKSDFNALVAKFNAHTHPYVGLVVGVPGTTTPTTTPGTASSADMSGAKINEIKTS